MKMEAVTVSVGYADYLRQTVPFNRHFFDRWVIVTTKADKDTFAVCHKFNLPCLLTEDFFRDGVFNKGRGIQRGLNSLSCSDWIMHLDADIVLPPHCDKAMTSAHLDPRKLYGCDRQLVRGWDRWQAVQKSGYTQASAHCYVLPHDKYPFGARWVSPTDGYVPIGFMQLWNGQTSVVKGIHQRPYPGHHSNAARSDVQFGLQWDRRDRELLPEFIVWHLEGESDVGGANWDGRTTKRFGFAEPHHKHHPHPPHHPHPS